MLHANTRSLLAVTLIAICCGLIAPSLHAADYYLSPEGDDANEGTREAPWQSIERANEALEPGDTAIFLPGEYPGPINPANSGTADAPITYRSAERRAARLVRGETPEIISVTDREHIVIADFFVDGGTRTNWGTIADSHNITVEGCEMRSFFGGSFYIFMIRDSSQIRLLDNVFDRSNGRCVDMVKLLRCTHVLFEGNSTARAGHNTLTISRSNYVVVRGNVLHNEWGRNHTLWDAGRTLIEGNIMTRARDSAGSAGSVSQTSHDYSIVRFNRVFDNLHRPLAMSSYIYGGASRTGQFRGPFVNVNNRFYHNVFADNLGTAISLGQMNTTTNQFQNNIFYRNDWAGGDVHITRPDGISHDNRFITNLFRSDEPGQARVSWAGSIWSVEEANERTRTVGDFWSEFYQNIDEDPDFVDSQNRDYRLSPGSEAIDAGAALTWTLGAGAGRELPVDDGVPFYDGFGIDGEEGDFIAIGSGDNIAQIERVELRYRQAAILHLDREVTWEDGTPVSMPWAGEAPDMGAYEHGLDSVPRISAVARPALAEPGEPVQFTLDASGGELESVTWDFADGNLSDEIEPTHTFEDTGPYGVSVRATFSDGTRKVDVAFVRVRETVDPSAPFVAADFEEETRGETWGYHFKFYRGHQTGFAHVEREDDEGHCMHIYYNDDKANRTAAQIAPGEWDIDRYPIVRFDYRIPHGVPVTVNLTPFDAPDRPSSFIIAATENQAARITVPDGYTLVDDGEWHTLTMDVREVREVYPDLQHLRQWMFNTPWATVPPPVGWLIFPAVDAPIASDPDGPDDVATLRNLDIMLLRADEPGQWLEMGFTLEEETTGEVFVKLLDHDSRGAVSIMLNDEIVVEDYEHWTDGTVPARVSLGEMTLPAGEHTVRVEVLERRVGMIGLSGVGIRPEGTPDAPDLSLEDFEFWFDNFSILPE